MRVLGLLCSRMVHIGCWVPVKPRRRFAVMRYATRAALLLEGRIAKSWDAEQFKAMRIDGPEALELALAAYAEGHVA